MATTPSRLMTADEFRELPEATGEYSYELHHGVVVPVTRPKPRHLVRQRCLRKLLEAAAPKGSFAEIEVPFRAVTEYDLRVADVAYLNRDRWIQVDPNDDIRGAPDLVVEVLSPSNKASEMLEKERLCLENGCLEFWIVDEEHRQIRVTTADGRTATYKSGQSIPLTLVGRGELAVNDVFTDCTRIEEAS